MTTLVMFIMFYNADVDDDRILFVIDKKINPDDDRNEIKNNHHDKATLTNQHDKLTSLTSICIHVYMGTCHCSIHTCNTVPPRFCAANANPTPAAP